MIKNHSLKSRIYNLGSKRGFSLLEITITVALLIVLLIVAIAIFNPQGQINKAWDGKRKTDLATLRRVLEDWYNDKGCFPRPDQICYDSSASKTCHICGTTAGSPQINPYLATLPCDPQQSSRQFLYEVDDVNCPTMYRIYTKLSITFDPAITELGCQNGCGPYGTCLYNYGVTSTNTAVQYCTLGPTNTPTPSPTPYYVGPCSAYNPIYYIADKVCNICGTYSECKPALPNDNFYIDPGGHGLPGCTQQCFKD